MKRTLGTPARYLEFEGLRASVAIADCDELLPIFQNVFLHWRFRVRSCRAVRPCVEITHDGDGSYLCNLAERGTKPLRWDAVNTVCETVAELAWEQIRANTNWLCLHCAAVVFGGRLVIFPNTRRAGKSTLAAVLAARGHTVFTDDFLPVSIWFRFHWP